MCKLNILHGPIWNAIHFSVGTVTFTLVLGDVVTCDVLRSCLDTFRLPFAHSFWHFSSPFIYCTSFYHVLFRDNNSAGKILMQFNEVGIIQNPNSIPISRTVDSAVLTILDDLHLSRCSNVQPTRGYFATKWSYNSIQFNSWSLLILLYCQNVIKCWRRCCR